ncbi:alpha-xylosidase [Pseudoclavibacter sp. AY1F1]|uniref:alpha-xylosidase n=1 Tax=Pseudoclavibacter sp. AY1F1 TaxID=2080583 RepID=UPI000CE7F4E9|nr:alpha-xylosidase [Pseudoclavibacter sp. AY1F1]PPF46868.1 alpha-xylosidase [Pseudoclavibacter sp. AY1F1]
MKFTDGFWHPRPGAALHYAREIDRVEKRGSRLVAVAPTKPVLKRGDVLNQPLLTVSLSAPMDDVIRVHVLHHAGRAEPLRFDVTDAADPDRISVDEERGTITSGALHATLTSGPSWDLTFAADGRALTRNGSKSVAWASVASDAKVEHGPIELQRPGPTSYMFAQLDLDVGEVVYGLGERFGPVVKNGQSVDIWNYDGGTSSEQAYKNIPFYLTNRGYGVFVNDPGHVSYEVGSEAVERVQFSVQGESLEYFIIYGPEPKAILEKYTALTGRPASVPAWTYGLWLSTSFTTDYDEATVNRFVDGMFERDLPLSVFHFDCFWMRGFNWCDLVWDERLFPDPDAMLRRLHDKGLKICVWINPYIAQESPLFAEGMAAGYLVKRSDGSVWQWDRWQAGMGLVDFTNPDAAEWFKAHLRRLVRQGVDCFKTDFGERIPVDGVYSDGSDGERMHNLYTHLYNRAVHEALVEELGEGEATLFARSATAGGQKYPVHWGGDSTSSFASMAETLRGGLSLAFSGFGYWSHDIGGFEGVPDSAVFKRWTAFGLLSSHSRLHASESYRVPWDFDTDVDESDAQSAVSVLRKFTRLKATLMPYLLMAGREASAAGTPIMRPLLLEFPHDPSVEYLERQYMLGSDLLVAPVFSSEGRVDFYLPAGRWVSLLTQEVVEGGRWIREEHAFDSVPLYLRAGAAIALGEADALPERALTTGILVHPDGDDGETVIAATDGATFVVTRDAGHIVVTGPEDRDWTAAIARGRQVDANAGTARL